MYSIKQIPACFEETRKFVESHSDPKFGGEIIGIKLKNHGSINEVTVAIDEESHVVIIESYFIDGKEEIRYKRLIRKSALVFAAQCMLENA